MTATGSSRYFLLAFIIGVGVVVFYILQPFLAPLALAAVFAVVLQPLYRSLVRALRGRESLASLFTVLICIVAVLVPLTFFGARLLLESQALYASTVSGEWRVSLDDAVATTGPWLERYIPNASVKVAEISASLDEYARAGLAWLIANLGPAFSGLSAFFLGLFIFFVGLYYLLRDGKALCRYLVRLSPLPDKDDGHILERLETAVNSVVRGKLLIALIQGVLAGVGLAIFGVPNAIIWALVASVAALIPPFGTALVMVPAALYALLAGNPAGAVGLLIWGVIAGGVDNVIGPKLMASGTDQHPILMLLSVLGGIAFFGPVGVFIGPLTISLFLTLLSLHMDLRDDGSIAKSA